ncbi:MAG: hypothetical protein NTX42_01660 [Methanothrix sp.]|nr:hypothetical protein [Methanothrix sp.]
MKRLTGDWTVTSFIGILVIACTLAGSCQAATYDSMKSYEDLLRSQTVLIGSFENLLKNSTLVSGDNNYHYKFLDSFDDLAMREQLGLNSFEDLVSRNWSTLSTSEKISLTQSFEDLIRREATVLSSNEDLLKRGYCNLNDTQKQDLLDRFEARLKYEVNLYTKFEDWLHFQQTIENEGKLKPTWIRFLDSFEDLIRRQARLLDSFEMLLKIRCDNRYLILTKTVVGNDNFYSYTVTAGPDTAATGVKLANVSINDSLMGFVAQGITLSSSSPSSIVTKGPLPTSCADCNNCTCNVCNFATACGDVVTPNGNFTVCVVSNQVCLVVPDYPQGGNPVVYPGVKINETTTEGTDLIYGNSSQEVSGGAEDYTCPSCSKH